MLNKLYGLQMESEEAVALLAARAAPLTGTRGSPDVVLSQVGEELYRKLFEGYQRPKHLLSRMDSRVCKRNRHRQ